MFYWPQIIFAFRRIVTGETYELQQSVLQDEKTLLRHNQREFAQWKLAVEFSPRILLSNLLVSADMMTYFSTSLNLTYLSHQWVGDLVSGHLSQVSPYVEMTGSHTLNGQPGWPIRFHILEKRNHSALAGQCHIRALTIVWNFCTKKNKVRREICFESGSSAVSLPNLDTWGGSISVQY